MLTAKSTAVVMKKNVFLGQHNRHTLHTHTQSYVIKARIAKARPCEHVVNSNWHATRQNGKQQTKQRDKANNYIGKDTIIDKKRILYVYLYI